MKFDLTTLNGPQREAVETINGPLLVLAGAGSGKTRVITYRIVNLVKRGVYPQKILAVTFTNKAAGEMKERLIELLGKEIASKLTVSTFHSLGLRILREDGKKIGIKDNFVIYDDSDVERVIKEILKEKYKIKNLEPSLIRQVKYIILEAKSNKITPQNFPRDGISEEMLIAQKVYEYYENYMRIYNAVDFTDLIVKPVFLFENFESVKKKYHKRYDYIMIDEYQDTNDIQFEFINHILNEKQNICVVGDDDQSIYGFRGANVDNILQFTSKFKDAKEIKLEQNYRSTENIIEAANFVIKKNSKRNKKTLFSKLGKGEKLKLYMFDDVKHQASGVANKIKDYIRKGVKPQDIAVMYRSNHQAREIELKLKELEVPYKLVGAVDFYSKKEIKDFTAYLMVLVFPNSEVHLKRIINYPSRGIGAKSIQVLSDYAHENKKSFYTALREAGNLGLPNKTLTGINDFLKITDKYKRILNLELNIENLYSYADETGFVEQLIKDSKNETQAQNKKRNLKLFLEGIAKYVEMSGMNLEEYLRKFVLEPDSLKKEEKKEVTLLSIHASKGLEFPYVFLIGVNEGIIPHQRSLDTKLRKDIEEERRLFYVALTRAKKELIMTAMKYKDNGYKRIGYEISSFYDDIPKKLVKEVNYSSGESDISVDETAEFVMGELDKLFSD